MSEPVTIELAGMLDLGEQEGGFNSDEILIDGEYLDVTIARAMGYPQGGRRGPCVNATIGRCELTLRIWPKEQDDGQT